MSGDEKLLLASLDRIEQREARLLTWGLVDGFLTLSELSELIDPLLDDPAYADGLTFVSVAEVVAALQRRTLLLDIGDSETSRFRSRMAEAVRLFFRLRQLFPQHQGLIGWQSAPTLVADFRFIWRRRRYPRRQISAERARVQIQAATSDASARDALSILINSYGPDFGLASFQVDAAERILAGFEQPLSIATLVSAGTGSGKTLAFYLPSLARIASHIQRDPSASRWVKVLALYPRNELLKDQFAEVYGQARRLDASLLDQGCRKILIGTYFGPTPKDAADAETRTGWRRHRDGLICDYLRCPTDGCDGDMVWHSLDRGAGKERLVCQTCAASIESDEVILTRQRLERESPDILFTTTEMLNQRMGDDRVRHLFGLGDRCERPVELMLLDEVHTYSGTSGAQVAFLLRRWRRLLRRSVSFVGLSATIADGARFFARLTGLHEQASLEIAPRTCDMIAEGAEYLLALRGDPVSRTALLSTTIQSAMLLSRMLDAPDLRRSQGVFGERLFLFADNLDVINRMFFAMLDAEGRQSGGRIDMNRHPNGGLASLRTPMASEHRKLHGQDWQAAVDIGHTLQSNDRKTVGRVMSMDPGVGSHLDIIVATASLEVGYNDPLVGAVIQHKAPNDVAQFLQRKGRAGRSRSMRPWTVVILSDYGRDRIAYQGYDLLFDPEVSPRSLPINNRYVERIQAVYATLDYLSLTIGSNPRGSVWINMYGPAATSNQRARQTKLADATRRILTNDADFERYADYLGQALKLDRSEIDALLWDHPRPLLLEVLPTALRRLESRWLAHGEEGADYKVGNSPLPEFAPANLFSDLNLPEVEIVLGQSGSATPERVVMPISQAMKEYAAGRVSRRYGISHALERHWICPPLDQNIEQSADLSHNVRADFIGDWQIRATNGNILQVPVYRPREFLVQQPANTVVDTSTARLRWRSQLVAREVGLVLAPPIGSPWAAFIAGAHFYTHQSLSPVEARRMAIGSDADIRYRDGTSYTKKFNYEIAGGAAALGFSFGVDAFCLRLRFPEKLWSSLGTDSDPSYRAIRTARFHDQAVNGPYLDAVENRFAREWLAHLLLAAISNEAIAKAIGLEEAADNLAQGRAELSLDQTLSILFQSPIVDDPTGQGNVQDKLRQDLALLIADRRVRTSLFSLAEILWQPIAENWEPWLRERFAATTAAAALNAILSLCPEVDANGLVIDIDAGPREPDDVFADEPAAEIWISETAPGGNGQIEEALRQYAEDPRRFYNLMTASLRDNDFALSDYQLQRFLNLVVEDDPDGDLAIATGGMRGAYGAAESHRALSVLRERLAAEGFVTFHAFMVALVNRVIRPGSTRESDAFFLGAVRQWSAEEERLGVELDARVVAYRLSRRDDIDTALRFAGIDAPTVNPDQWRFGVIYGLLWPRGAQIRQAGLHVYSQFADLPAPEPLLVMPFLAQENALIDLENDQWQPECLERLGETGAATLVCPMNQAGRVADAFNFLATNPVQTGYLSVFARVQAVRRSGGAYHIDVDIAEALQ
ncbi:protein DpdJ [Devosia aquimaris]|uniref:protein DpdJ n=1 Tax=Devosia aquimaris TaxID=2866214 RepID=UPI001CD0DEF7|nr:protein DpdJ [Devosia sp. CJK-A8-3]